MRLAEFKTRYPEYPPRRAPANEDELRKLGEDEGVVDLGLPPARSTVRVRPAKKGDHGCHLWVFIEESIPYLLERAPIAGELTSGVVKHTNLTGGAVANCGGELWVDPDDPCRLYVNGCSGRYGPESANQLMDAVEVFQQLGFRVRSFGWDHDVDLPAMVLRD